MKSSYFKKIKSCVGSFFISLLLVCLVQSSAAQSGLSFNRYELHSGTPGENHCVYRFLLVAKGVDALVKIKKRSAANIILENIDVDYTGYKDAFQPRIGPAGGQVNAKTEWWMDFEIRFVKSGSLTSVHVKTFYATALDVDGDGTSIREFIEFYKAENYVVEAGSLLKIIHLPSNKNEDEDEDDDDDEDRVNGRGKRFTAPITNFVDIDTTATKVMATMKYKHSNKITIRIGATKENATLSTAGYRYNSIWFKSFDYVSASFLPVNLTGFSIVTEKNHAKLQWSTSSEINASHFVIQKSEDGKNFKDAAIIFTEGNSGLTKNYKYSDVLSPGQQLVYYRLKIVDLDGAYAYSETKVSRVRTTGKLSVYPNPVARELYITLPTDFQQQRITIEISNQQGQITLRRDIPISSQTEIIPVFHLPKGIYQVRIANGKEQLIHKIIK